MRKINFKVIFHILMTMFGVGMAVTAKVPILFILGIILVIWGLYKMNDDIE